jgi:hypothetical protein
VLEPEVNVTVPVAVVGVRDAVSVAALPYVTVPLLPTARDIDVGIRSITRTKVSVPVPLVFVALTQTT